MLESQRQVAAKRAKLAGSTAYWSVHVIRLSEWPGHSFTQIKSILSPNRPRATAIIRSPLLSPLGPRQWQLPPTPLARIPRHHHHGCRILPAGVGFLLALVTLWPGQRLTDTVEGRVGGPTPPPPHGRNRGRRTLKKHGPISRRRADSAGARRGVSATRASWVPAGLPPPGRAAGPAVADALKFAPRSGGVGGGRPPPPPSRHHRSPRLGARAPAWATRADRWPSKPPPRAASWQWTPARHGSAAAHRAGPKSALVASAPAPALQVQFERLRRRRRGHRRCARRAACVAAGPLGHPCRARFLCCARRQAPHLWHAIWPAAPAVAPRRGERPPPPTFPAGTARPHFNLGVARGAGHSPPPATTPASCHWEQRGALSARPRALPPPKFHPRGLAFPTATPQRHPDPTTRCRRGGGGGRPPRVVASPVLEGLPPLCSCHQWRLGPDAAPARPAGRSAAGCVATTGSLMSTRRPRGAGGRGPCVPPPHPPAPPRVPRATPAPRRPPTRAGRKAAESSADARARGIGPNRCAVTGLLPPRPPPAKRSPGTRRCARPSHYGGGGRWPPPRWGVMAAAAEPGSWAHPARALPPPRCLLLPTRGGIVS